MRDCMRKLFIRPRNCPQKLINNNYPYRLKGSLVSEN
jgi:hypothetical protein